MFECLINTTPQNTTTNHHQARNAIQELKFGVYSLVVYFQTQLSKQTHKTQPTLVNHLQIKHNLQKQIQQQKPTISNNNQHKKEYE